MGFCLFVLLFVSLLLFIIVFSPLLRVVQVRLCEGEKICGLPFGFWFERGRRALRDGF